MNRIKLAFAISALLISNITLADLNTGLVAHYSFDDCSANDSSGNNRNGAIQGNPTCENGIIGKALQFNTSATTDWIDLGTSFPSFPKFTISAWINIANMPTYSWCHEGVVFAKGSACTNENISYYMSIEGSSEPMFIRQDIGDGTGLYVSVGTYQKKHLYPPKTNQWIHLISTYDGKSLSLYGNGIKISSVKANLIPQDNSLATAIGKSLYDSTPTAFSGILDEIRIYNRALSSSEVQQLYYQGFPPTVKGTISWAKPPYSVQCVNNTTVQSIAIPKNATANYDCEKAGLVVKSGDDISVTVRGKKY